MKIVSAILSNVLGSDWRDIGKRAAKTGIQSAVGVAIIIDWDEPEVAVVAIVSAFLAVLWNAFSPNSAPSS